MPCCAALQCPPTHMCVTGTQHTQKTWGGGMPGSGCHCIPITAWGGNSKSKGK